MVDGLRRERGFLRDELDLHVRRGLLGALCGVRGVEPARVGRGGRCGMGEEEGEEDRGAAEMSKEVHGSKRGGADRAERLPLLGVKEPAGSFAVGPEPAASGEPQPAISAKVSRAAAIVASMTASSCAIETKPASKVDGAK